MALFNPLGNTLEERLQNSTYRQLFGLHDWGLNQDICYWNFGYPLLTAALPLLRTGTIFTISPENVGKSQFLCNLGYGILSNTEGAYWLDFSLDDSVEDRLSYLLARSGDLPINLIKQAGRAEEEEKERRRIAFRNFYQANGAHYKLIGTTELAPIEGEDEEEEPRYSVEHIGGIIREARRELGPEAKLFVTIDGFHDLDLEAAAEDENRRLAEKSLFLKRLATKTKSLIWMTAHTRKDSRHRGMTSDALKGEGRILFDAKAITHLYSDLNLNHDNASIFWEEREADNSISKRPVLELDILKTKVGHWKGVLFYQFEPRRSQLHESSEAEQAFYRNIIFSR